MAQPAPKSFERENALFEERREEWLKDDHGGEFVVIKGREVGGFFPSFSEAYSHGVSTFGEHFLVREVKGTDDIEHIHRVSWAWPGLGAKQS